MGLLLSILLSFFAVRGFRFELTTDYFAYVNTLSFNWLLLFIFFIWVIKESFAEKDKRLKLFAAGFAVVIAGLYIVGISISKMYRISWIWESRGLMLNTFNLFFSHAFLYYAFAFLAFRFLRDTRFKAADKSHTFSLKRVLVYWGILLVLYLPWYLHLYPGMLSPDSGTQIRDAIKTNTLSNHHSAFLDLILRGILLPVRQMTGSLQTGVGICILLQMLILTFVFAVSYERIRRYLHNRLLRAITFIWFAVYPVSQLFSVTLWKDILFSVCFLILILCIDSAVQDEYAFFRSRKRCFLLFFTMLLLPLMRHNGWSVTMVMCLYFLFRFKGYRRQVIAGCAGIALVFGIWRLIVFPALHGVDVAPRHLYSVQEQQIVRVLEERRSEIPEKELAELESYFDIPEIWTVYNPRLSDPVKNHFRDDRYNEDPKRFFTVWAQLGKRYPVIYLESILINNYGYWFPEVHPWISDYAMAETAKIEDIHPAPILEIGPVQKVITWMAQIQYTKTPVLWLFFSMGAAFWAWLFFGFYCLYQNTKKFVLFLPGLALWLGILVTPIAIDFRYVYALFISLPLLLASVLSSQDDPGEAEPVPSEE